MNSKITFIFKHKKDEDLITETYTIKELIYGVGETKQPVKDLIAAYEEDGYILIGRTETTIKNVKIYDYALSDEELKKSFNWIDKETERILKEQKLKE